MIELRPLSKEAVPAALEKATRYRLLNEPGQAESICLDVLAAEPDNGDAAAMLLLALTDQFPRRLAANYRKALEAHKRLEGDYSRAYYLGVIYERRAKAHLRQGSMSSGYVAYDWYHKAMAAYEEAIELRPEGCPDPILRWNTCARAINENPKLVPEPEEQVQYLLDSRPPGV